MICAAKKEKQHQSRVVITGMGATSSAGQGVPALTQALQTGQRRFARSFRFPQLAFPVLVAELNDITFEKNLAEFKTIPENILARALKAGRRAPKVIQASLIAALEAWSQAKLFHRTLNPARLGLVIAGHNTTQGYQHSLYAAFQQEPGYLSPTYALHFMDTDQVGTLSEVLGIQGEGITVGGASASGNVGLIQGYRMIQQGLVDSCLVVGVLADLSPLEIQGFFSIGAMGGKHFAEEPMQACRPFDRDREGFIWGQASGCIVLEAAEIAEKANILPLGEIAGTAIVLDGHRLSAPNLRGETKAMRQALDEAGLNPIDIQYINTHGSSSIIGDETELAAIHEVYKSHINTIWLNATKGLLGHCLWSAGVIEAIATLVQLQGGFVHPNLNLDHPLDEQCRFVGEYSQAANINIAMSNSFGFGGINTSIVFLKGGDIYGSGY